MPELRHGPQLIVAPTETPRHYYRQRPGCQPRDATFLVAQQGNRILQYRALSRVRKLAGNLLLSVAKASGLSANRLHGWRIWENAIALGCPGLDRLHTYSKQVQEFRGRPPTGPAMCYNEAMGIDEILGQLNALYARMDEAYSQLADELGLTCDECADSCCVTHFHHHTLVEWLHLGRAISILPTENREEVVARANAQVSADCPGIAGKDESCACPLLEWRRCLLHASRPMICRLHGVPWVLRRGRLADRVQQGCHRALVLLSNNGRSLPLDRTDLYADLADLERSARQISGRPERIRFTIAELVLNVASREGW